MAGARFFLSREEVNLYKSQLPQTFIPLLLYFSQSVRLSLRYHGTTLKDNLTFASQCTVHEG